MPVYEEHGCVELYTVSEHNKIKTYSFNSSCLYYIVSTLPFSPFPSLSL